MPKKREKKCILGQILREISLDVLEKENFTTFYIKDVFFRMSKQLLFFG